MVGASERVAEATHPIREPFFTLMPAAALQCRDPPSRTKEILVEEQRTEQSIIIRQVTAIQASWTERGRGEPGAFTVQLILDNGAEEYVLQPEEDDLDILLELFKRSPHVTFDVQRKVLIFGNIGME